MDYTTESLLLFIIFKGSETYSVSNNNDDNDNKIIMVIESTSPHCTFTWQAKWIT